MFQDIGVSKDLNDKFKCHLANTESLDCKLLLCVISVYSIVVNAMFPVFSDVFFLFLCVVDFSIQVLSSGSWPFQQSVPFSLPAEVRQFRKVFCNLHELYASL